MHKLKYNQPAAFWEEALPLCEVYFPAVQAGRTAFAGFDRQIAVLRVFEALRLYGASHDGRLPEGVTELIVSFGVWDHFRSMMRGLFRLQDAVWFASLILLSLIGTRAVLSAKRS